MSIAGSSAIWPRLLLGAFIVWQLIFLLSGNAAALLPGPAQPIVGAPAAAWEAVTGQGQNWRLFAPLVPKRTFFVVVEARSSTMDRPIRLLSSFEPDDDGRYVHLPGSGDRLFHFEKELCWPLRAYESSEDVAARADEWREYLDNQIRGRWRAYRGYLAWQRREYQRENPNGTVPQEWILLVRIYPRSVAGKQAARHDIIEMPIVRWRPDAVPPTGCLPLEVDDSGGWRWLREGEVGG